MADILNLALPCSGLIFIGFACGKAEGAAGSGLALDELSSCCTCRCRRCCSASCPRLPFAELNNPPFLVAITRSGTMSAFVLAMVLGRGHRRAFAAQGHHRGAFGRLRKHRLHGTGPGAGGARRRGRRADRADFLLRQHIPVFHRAAPDRVDQPRASLAFVTHSASSRGRLYSIR